MSGAGASPRDLVTAIQRLGRLMASRQGAATIRAVAGVDVSQQGIQILRVLDRGGWMPTVELASRAQMDVGAVSRQRRLLEAQGLVETKADPGDGRVVLVSTTAAGARAAGRVRDVGTRHLADATSDWGPGERSMLAELLTRLVDDLLATDVRPAPRTVGGTRPGEGKVP